VIPKRVAVTFRDHKRIAPYVDALRTVGIEPVLIEPVIDSVDSLSGMEGLLLTGGTDVDPALYGQTLGPKSDVPDRERDDLEQRLLREALEADLPVLAICRGMQLFNVTHPGGTLVQDVDGHKLLPLSSTHKATHHAEIYEGTRLAKIFDAGVHAVNSRHHQAVAQVGEGLLVSAKSPDGVIEGLERPDLRFAVAVQWHPEDQMPQQRRLFEAFGEAL
jgi:putative glutamine amidotransferase